MSSHVLPDVLQDGLRVVFCGTAAGTESARRGAYYAGRGNKFWTVLHDTKLTPCTLRPEEFDRLREYGIGLTDVSKTASGMDHELPANAFDPARLREVIARCAPLAVAFNGKSAARIALGVSNGATLGYGRASDSLAGVPTWILPSTSGANARYWDSAPWHELARSLPPTTPPAVRREADRRVVAARRPPAVVATIVAAGAAVSAIAMLRRSRAFKRDRESAPEDAAATS